MKIKLDMLLKDLDGKEVGEDSLGKALANLLAANSDPIEPMKGLEWAQSLWRHKEGEEFEELEIDTTDMAKLKKYVLDNKGMTTIAKGQILVVLEKASAG